MSKQKRIYFVTGPSGSGGRLFLKGNKPDQDIFRDLRDSTPFFLEDGDAALTSQRGLVYKSSDAHVQNRDANFNKALVAGQSYAVQQHQIPSLIVDTNPVAKETSEIANGIKIEAQTETGATSGFSRTNYKVTFDPSTLPIVALGSQYVVVSDKTTGVPQLVDIADIRTSWTKTNDTEISADDKKLSDVRGIDLSTADIQSTDAVSAEVSINAIASKTGIGQGVKIEAGQSSDNSKGGGVQVLGAKGIANDGGDVLVQAGNSDVQSGGTTDLKGGVATGVGGVHGNVRAVKEYGIFEVGSAARGVGDPNPTAPITDNIQKIYGNIEIDGSIQAVSGVFSKGIVLGDYAYGAAGAVRISSNVPQYYHSINGWTDFVVGSVTVLEINDTTNISTTKVWSASKIYSELSGKSDTSHNHNSLYVGVTGSAYDSDRLGGQVPSYYATSADLSAAVMAAANGIVYSWANIGARDAQTGHAVGDMGIIDSITNRPVYRANSVAVGAGSWDLAYYMDAAHTHPWSEITSQPTIPSLLIDLGENSASRHLTDAQKALWDAKADASNVYTKAAADVLYDAKTQVDDAATNVTDTWSSSKLSTDLGLKAASVHTHVATQVTQDATHRFITDAERIAWDAKSAFDGDFDSLTNKPLTNTAGNIQNITGADLGIGEAPLSGIHSKGSMGAGGATYSNTLDFNITAGEMFVYITSGTGAGNGYLPAAATATNRWYEIINSTAQNAGILPQVGETLNGAGVGIPIPTGEIWRAHCYGGSNWNMYKIG